MPALAAFTTAPGMPRRLQLPACPAPPPLTLCGAQAPLQPPAPHSPARPADTTPPPPSPAALPRGGGPPEPRPGFPAEEEPPPARSGPAGSGRWLLRAARPGPAQRPAAAVAGLCTGAVRLLVPTYCWLLLAAVVLIARCLPVHRKQVKYLLPTLWG